MGKKGGQKIQKKLERQYRALGHASWGTGYKHRRSNEQRNIDGEECYLSIGARMVLALCKCEDESR